MSLSPGRSLILLLKPQNFMWRQMLRKSEHEEEKNNWNKINTALFVIISCMVLVALNFPFYYARQAQNSLEDFNQISSGSGIVREVVKSVSDWRQQSLFDQPTAAVIASMKKEAARLPLLSQQRDVLELLEKVEASQKEKIKVVVHAPESWRVYMERGLDSNGFVLIPSDRECSDCLILSWTGKDWQYSGKPAKEQDSLVLSTSLSLAARTAQSEVQKDIKIPSIELNNKIFEEDARKIGLRSLEFSINAAFFVVCWMLITLSSAVGFSWDRRRNRGNLEPWTISYHPPWVLYGAELISIIIYSLLFLVLLSVLAFVWGLPLCWPMIGSLFIFVPLGMFVVGLWSMLATVLFHGKQGRKFSRLLFLPIFLMVGWTVRLFFVWSTLKINNPMAAYKLMDNFLENGYLVFLALSPFLFLLSWVLWRLVEWRIGSRRNGLRACK